MERRWASRFWVTALGVPRATVPRWRRPPVHTTRWRRHFAARADRRHNRHGCSAVHAERFRETKPVRVHAF